MLPSPNESTSVTVLMKDIYFMRYIMYSVIKYQVSMYHTVVKLIQLLFSSKYPTYHKSPPLQSRPPVARPPYLPCTRVPE